MTYELRRDVPGAAAPADLARILAALHSIAGRRGSGEERGGGVEWTSAGHLDQVRVTVTPGPDATGVTVRGDRTATAVLVLSLPLAAWVIAFGVSVAVIDPTTSAEVIALAGGYLVAAVAAARTIWSRTAAGFRRLLGALAEAAVLEVEGPG